MQYKGAKAPFTMKGEYKTIRDKIEDMVMITIKTLLRQLSAWKKALTMKVL